MKKLIIAIVAASMFSLVGCNKSNEFKDPGYFKTLSFNSSPISDTAKSVLLKGIETNRASICAFETKTENWSKVETKEYKDIVKQTIKYSSDSKYEGSLITSKVIEETGKNVEGGVTFEINSKIEAKEWNAGEGLVYKTQKSTVNKKTVERYYAYSYESTTDDVNDSFPSLNDYTFYKKSDGTYVGVQSTVARKNASVDWGYAKYKDEVNTRRYQYIATVSKDYRLTSYTAYTDYSSNRDTETGSWYDKETFLFYKYFSEKYEYGKMASESIDTLNKNSASKSFLYSATICSTSGNMVTKLGTGDRYAVVVSDNTVTKQTNKYSNGREIELSAYDVLTYQQCNAYFIEATFVDTSGSETVKNIEVDLGRYFATNETYAIVKSGENTYIGFINDSNSNYLTIMLAFEFDGKDLILVNATANDDI